jgi:hypothetical protein
MTRREAAFFAIGAGLSGLFGSLVVAYEYARNIMDVPDFSTALEVMGINRYAFLLPIVVLMVGIALFMSEGKSKSISK